MGSGADNKIQFDDLYKFLQELGREQGREMYSISDLKQAIRSGSISRERIERAYARATGKSTPIEVISRMVGNTVRIIEMTAVENTRFY